MKLLPLKRSLHHTLVIYIQNWKSNAIRRYWQDKLKDNTPPNKIKVYNSNLIIDLPHKPGVLGEISTLIGLNSCNIINVELLDRRKDYLQFSFDIQINDLKKLFTNLISQIKQKNFKFKIVRHKHKKNAFFLQQIFENF